MKCLVTSLVQRPVLDWPESTERVVMGLGAGVLGQVGGGDFDVPLERCLLEPPSLIPSFFPAHPLAAAADKPPAGSPSPWPDGL